MKTKTAQAKKMVDFMVLRLNYLQKKEALQVLAAGLLRIT